MSNSDARNRSSNLYQGYHIYTHSAGGASPPYTAAFGFAKAEANGAIGPVEDVQCTGTYETEHEAHAAANVEARRHVDAFAHHN
jgi:hypothetical protein